MKNILHIGDECNGAFSVSLFKVLNRILFHVFLFKVFVSGKVTPLNPDLQMAFVGFNRFQPV